jgi:hypothetical protein
MLPHARLAQAVVVRVADYGKKTNVCVALSPGFQLPSYTQIILLKEVQ